MTAVDAEKRRVSLSMKARHIGLQPPSHRVAAPRVSLSMKALALLVVSDQLKAEATTTIYTSILAYYYTTNLLSYDC